jgi:hypothetical protein
MKQIIIIAIILLLNIGGRAQDNKKETVVQQTQIENLQKQISELKDEIQKIDKGYSVKEIDIKDYIQDKYIRWWNPILWIVITIVSIIGALIGYFGIKKDLSMKIDKKIMDELDNYLKSSEWTNALKAKISKQIAENKFKEALKIHVLSVDQTTEDIIRNYFTENNFNENNIIYKQGININLESEKMDLMFINNKDDAFQMNTNPFDTLIAEIKKKQENLAVFYFNDSNVRFPSNLDQGLNSNFSNSFASLYHNLLDLMRYKYLVIDRKTL